MADLFGNALAYEELRGASVLGSRGSDEHQGAVLAGPRVETASLQPEESTMSAEVKTLYERLGGYDAITAVANDLLPRL